MARIPKPKAIADLHGDKTSDEQNQNPFRQQTSRPAPRTLDDDGNAHWEETVRNLDEIGPLESPERVLIQQPLIRGPIECSLDDADDPIPRCRPPGRFLGQPILPCH